LLFHISQIQFIMDLVEGYYFVSFVLIFLILIRVSVTGLSLF